MLVKEDDESSEQAMHSHRQYDDSMNGALYKPKGKWPPSIQISTRIEYAQLGN